MPENHLLKRVIEKSVNCAVDISVLTERIDLTNRAIFLNPVYVRTVLSLYVQEKADAIYWMSAPIFFDSQLVFYYRTGLTESQVKAINRVAMAKLENSLHNYFYDLALIELEGKNVNLHVFTDLNEFIQRFTFFSEITLSSLRACFVILLLCELLVFILFLFSRTLAFLRRRCIWLSLRDSLIGNCL